MSSGTWPSHHQGGVFSRQARTKIFCDVGVGGGDGDGGGNGAGGG